MTLDVWERAATLKVKGPLSTLVELGRLDIIIHEW